MFMEKNSKLHFMFSRNNKMKWIIVLLLSIFILVSSWYAIPKVLLFDNRLVEWNFGHMEFIFPFKTIVRGDESQSLDREYKEIPDSYLFMNSSIELDSFLESTKTNGLLVIKDNKVVFEKYMNGYDLNSRFTSFSVAKSIIATSVGIAINEGRINSTQDTLDQYIEVLKGKAIGKATIHEVLNMSSGVNFTEEYDDDSTDAFTIFNDMFISMKSIDALAASYDRIPNQEEQFNYASINTHYLKLLLEVVYGKSLNEILAIHTLPQEKMKRFVSILTDVRRQEIGFWGINATLEDFGKFGMFMLEEFQEPNQLSDEWLQKILNPTEEYLRPPNIDGQWGYSNHWWVPMGEENDFSAIGIWGQFVYINPEQNVVIVKSSADPNFKSNEYETIKVFRQIVKYLSK